ncbi:MAG: DUF559 domain-containing protein [Candidatus Harrisonbacteria bacterium]|nr:DUF559 domain-containing protein [Candidatus Harrisonbacteria bacterium]
MRQRYYRKKDDLMGGVEGIAGLYVLYLVFLWFTDKASFWRWVSYGVIGLASIYLIIFLIGKFNRGNSKGNYFSNWRYFGRRQPTSYARKLGNLLEGLGWRVEFEKWDGHKHIDIAITDAKTNIEVDGSQHSLNSDQAMADMKRDFYSEQTGFVTKRISNSLLEDDATAEEAARIISAQLRARVNELKK